MASESASAMIAELNKAGKRSRQSHPGNVPKIPQSQKCSVCDAKFTRQSHLKRHELTHSDERRFECKRCSFSFTRSDLLTRHQRTCRNSRNRKSCSSCLKAKIKCDFKQPCSMCKTRGLECTPESPPRELEYIPRKQKRPASPVREVNTEVAYYRQSNDNMSSQPQMMIDLHLIEKFARNVSPLPNTSNAFSLSMNNSHISDPLLLLSSADLDRFLFIFRDVFLEHVPIVHHHTCTETVKDPFLIQVAQACGAMLVKSDIASNFMIRTWIQASNLLTNILQLGVMGPYELTDLVMISNFLQGTQIMHSRDDNVVQSSTSLLIQIIRREAFIQRLRTFIPSPPVSKLHSALVAAWHCWAKHEMAKRSMWTLYIIDTVRFVFFGQQPNLTIEEMIITLPCDNSLWASKDAVEWFLVFTNVWSPEGADHVGVFLCDALQRLQTGLLRLIDLHSSCAMTVVVMTLLRVLNHLYLKDQSCSHEPLIRSMQSASGSPSAAEQQCVARVDTMLKNWAASWFSDHESRIATPAELGYLWHPMPYYWIAKISLKAYEHRQAPFDQFRTAEEIAGAMQKWKTIVFDTLRRHGDSGFGEPEFRIIDMELSGSSAQAYSFDSFI